MGNVPKRAFILAAGFGTRLRPYTDHVPKPMVKVCGRSLIWRSMDKLRDAGITEIVVNLHYMADILATHLDDYSAEHPDIVIHKSFERDLLDTGGGVKHALHYFGDEPFYVIAGDALWRDGTDLSALERLAQYWEPEKMDILTLMQPLEEMHLTTGVGDYDVSESGAVQRSHDKMGAYMWTNIRLNSPEIYRDHAGDVFSFLDIMDACEKQERFYALIHDGDWHHISTPRDLENVDGSFRKSEEQRSKKGAVDG